MCVYLKTGNLHRATIFQCVSHLYIYYYVFCMFSILICTMLRETHASLLRTDINIANACRIRVCSHALALGTPLSS